MNTRILLLFVLLISGSIRTYADEGMWLPLLLKQLNEARMQQLGLKLSADDLYNINKSSLKDAVVQFGRGCTGELISDKGLLITNHHCGYGQIQQHSSVQNDYLKNGFWAKKRSQELKNPGLTVTFIVRMEDVSAAITAGFDTVSSEAIREALLNKRSNDLIQQATSGTHYEAQVKPMYQGNEYYLFVTETFRDVRLVGAPPASIGNYGKDTDNWTWPRHTGDFSLFRIYADKNNNPADYSPKNVPYKPKHYFPVNISGLNEHDFTMVYGFPGRTNEYLTSYAVKQIVENDNPLKVDLRTQRLAVMKPAMDADREIFIQYAAKYSSVSNYQKKWSGESKGLKRANAIGKKQELEELFIRRITEDIQFAKYHNLLPQLKDIYEKLALIQPEADLMAEGILSVEILRISARLKELAELKGTDVQHEKVREKFKVLKEQMAEFYKDYNAIVDMEIMKKMLQAYLKFSTQKALPAYLSGLSAGKGWSNSDFKVETLYSKSILVKADSMQYWLENADTSLPAKLRNDDLFQVGVYYVDYYRNKAGKELQELNSQLAEINRKYIAALRNVFPEKKFYPDANATLRLAYGQTEGYENAESVSLPWFTDAEGILSKFESGNPDYELDPVLAAKIRARDFGQYADKDGKLHTCFIASNHTTGGNSGSPVLNGSGELIGVNFDRNWEGTMSDIFYDIKQVRNISVDIRYVLFLIDKVAGAGHLVKEMKIVRK